MKQSEETEYPNRRTDRCFRSVWLWVLLTLLLSAVPRALADDAERWQKLRARMIAAIEDDVTATRQWIDREALDPRVMEAVAATLRHEFVPDAVRRHAYENRPLPIGFGQTISQPYIVALMTDLIAPEPHHRVLEVGTGSAYQAAVLSPLVRDVYTMEIVPELARSAKDRLERLGYNNVFSRQGDGYYGWPDAAPFDGIVVTAVAGQIPPPLVAQLKPGGKMVIPVGHRFGAQYLMVVTKDPEGGITARQLLPVRFVPLTGDH